MKPRIKENGERGLSTRETSVRQPGPGSAGIEGDAEKKQETPRDPAVPVRRVWVLASDVGQQRQAAVNIQAPDNTHTPQPPLSYTQHLVLVRIARGLTNAAIGLDPGISEDTVKSHVGRIFRKLDVDDRAQAVAVGYQRRLLGHTGRDDPPAPIQAGDPPKPTECVPMEDATAFARAVGEVRREQRQQRGWLINEVSEATGLELSLISRLETGRRPLSMDRLALLSAALLISPVDVVQMAVRKTHHDGTDSDQEEHHGH